MQRLRFRRLFRFSSRSAGDVRADVREEVRFHLDMRTAELVRSGVPESQAREQAAREFGDARAAEAIAIGHGAAAERRRGIARLWSELVQDTRYGARMLARGPGFAAVAILTIGVAIGGNTAVFSMANALFLKSRAVRDAASLARVYTGESRTSWPNYQDIRARSRAFAEIAASRGAILTLATDQEQVRLIGEQTSTNYLDMLGVPALLGRTFTAADVRTDIVVLGERTWRTRLGADPAIVGRRIVLAGRPYEVIGVMPRRFRGTAPPAAVRDFWVPANPVAGAAQMTNRGAPGWEIAGRLSPGVTVAAAAAEARLVGQQLAREYPDSNGRFTAIEVFSMTGIGQFRGLSGLILPLIAFLSVLTIVSGFVLLIACANLAGLLLGRAEARRREIAVRLALGASRARLIRQLLTESLLLAGLGAAVGLTLAAWLARILTVLLARLPFPLEVDVSVDRRVLIYAALLAVLTTVLFGLTPARRSTRLALVPALKDQSGAARHRLRRALLIGQVAITTMLLLWSGLFLRSLSHAAGVDPGFDPRGVLVAEIQSPGDEGSPERGAQLLATLQKEASGLPGVTSIGGVFAVPLALSSRAEFDVAIDGDDRPRRRILSNAVSPGAFATLRIPILAGRDVAWTDRQGAPAVVLVNDTLARRFWNGNALGQRIRYGGERGDEVQATVIGVVRDSKYWTIGETIAPTLYPAQLQDKLSDVTLLVRTTDMAGTAAALTRLVRTLAPDRALTVKPMPAAIAVALLPAQVGSGFTGGFGAIAVLLAAMGVYGLVSFSVHQRTREIGIRKAIGATAADIARLVVGGTLRLVAAGLVVGGALGAAGAVLLGSLLIEVSPIDAATLSAVAAIVIGSAAAATGFPVLQAIRVDPTISLRAE
jgi:putative ABC transport system permease protein